MKISNQLLQPLLSRIEEEYQELAVQTQSLYSDEAKELKQFIAKKLRQLQTVRISLFYMGKDAIVQDDQQENLRETLRQHKLELRFARRRYHRQLNTQERFNKAMSESTTPTFAA